MYIYILFYNVYIYTNNMVPSIFVPRIFIYGSWTLELLGQKVGTRRSGVATNGLAIRY